MKLQKMFPLSYCVNLDKRIDRWQTCQSEFKKIDFYPERFSAIENANGAMGCHQSHLAILKKAQKENKNVFIFEDDLEIINFDSEILSHALGELDSIYWDMFYLGGNILRPFAQVTDHLAKLSHCQSTHAYGVNKEFLNKLVPFLEKNLYIVDVLYADGVIPYNNCFITIPMMAIQRQDFSDIENKIMDYSIPIARYNHFLVKRPPLTK